jgi:hypothetical protein
MSSSSLVIVTMAAATSSVPCEKAMAERDRMFRPIASEMKALLEEDRRLGGGKDGYPSLRLAQRFMELDQKMQTFERHYPARDCKAEKVHAQNH